MIWGMTLQPGYEYTEIVDDEVRLSMATLECRPRKSQGDAFELSSHVVLKTIRGEFLLCNLEKGPTPQQSLDLVLQPREKVTFSVEGTGVVHLMGYTSELPEEQLDQEDPIDNVTELPPAEHHPEPQPTPHPQEMEEIVQQLPLEEEHEDVTVKREPEAVVIPILEEALEEMEQAAKNEEETSSGQIMEENLSATTPIQAINSSDPSGGSLPSDNYGYQQMNQDQGWISQEQPRMRGVPTAPPSSANSQQSFTSGPMRSMQSGASPADMPSTSYSHSSQMQAGQSSRVPATRRPATSGIAGYQYMRPPVKSIRSLRKPSTNRNVNARRTVSQSINVPIAITDQGAGTNLGEWGDQNLNSASSWSLNDVNDANLTTGRQIRKELAGQSLQTDKKTYCCQHCGKEFTNRSTFLVHERKHTGKACFHCEYCMKPFANRSQLKIHERYHTGEKPFECRYCQKRFETSGNWRKHERCHTGEKPYSCTFCGKGFTDMSNWRKHERMHQQKQGGT